MLDGIGCPFAASLHARQGEVQTPPLLDHWLVAKLCRFAVPSAFDFAARTARDAFRTRHELARLPCRASGEVVRLSTVFDAVKPVHFALKGDYQQSVLLLNIPISEMNRVCEKGYLYYRLQASTISASDNATVRYPCHMT
ncbi:hypothetical protein [Dickeya fangzhongdai]|uniref:hypothetical protein n=1 Tax=Dickeya fangzhongdai TaxID=1778540 RepID=UPI0026E0A58E|nr:hypothetical protein [Dickeya fangzhongdai]WKV49830.1 hypothetical protein PL145_18200 [Dickeya fangzhongdai]